MITTDTGARGRGRPRQFDHDAVLDALIQLFWTRGYEAASVADMIELTGLSKSSLYGAFGSKEEILNAALERYLRGVAQILEPMESGSGGLADLHHFVDVYHSWLETDAGGRGCFALNSGAEMGMYSETVSDYAGQYRQMFRDAVGAALLRAADAGEIEPASVEMVREQLVGLIFAAALLNRSGASKDEREGFADSIHRLIDNISGERRRDSANR